MLKKDLSLIYNGRVRTPNAIIKFTKEPKNWYTIWDSGIIRRYKNEKLDKSCDFCMRPYLDSFYSLERKTTIFDMYDSNTFKFDTLITKAYFESDLQTVRK